jgi:hypothetical protein
MTYRTLMMACAAHRKKGEKVVEINVNPLLYSKYKIKSITYDNEVIPIISSGWKETEGYHYKELQTSEGVLIIREMTYRII